MVILDTNVLSELMRRSVDPAVLAWIDGVVTDSIWVTSVTVFEIRLGLEMMPVGRRRRELEKEFSTVMEDDLDGRVLPFDSVAAHTAASIAAVKRRGGRPIEMRDVQIAGIAVARKGTLATRNTRHFEGVGLSLVDPWKA